VGPDGIVDAFPSEQFALEGGGRLGEVVDLVELLTVRTLGALYVGIELGRAGRQLEERNARRADGSMLQQVT